MGIQKLISKAQQAAPQILRAVLAAVVLFPGTTFGYQRMNDEVICENGRGGQITRLAQGLVHNASYTLDKDGNANLKRVPRVKWLTALAPIRTNQPILLNGKSGVANGNAVFVSPCHVLTNHHMVFGDETLPGNDKTPEMKKRLKSKFSITLTSVGEDGKMSKPLVGRPVEWGDKYEDGQTAEDWALLELNECHGEKVGWVDIKESIDETIKGKKLAAPWYEDGVAAEKLLFHFPCEIDAISRTQKSFGTTCSSKSGASGRGTFAQEENERPKLVGLHVGSYRQEDEITRYEDGGVNTGVSSNSFYSKIYSTIEASKAKFLAKLRKSGKQVSDDFNPAFDGQ